MSVGNFSVNGGRSVAGDAQLFGGMQGRASDVRRQSKPLNQDSPQRQGRQGSLSLYLLADWSWMLLIAMRPER